MKINIAGQGIKEFADGMSAIAVAAAIDKDAAKKLCAVKVGDEVRDLTCVLHDGDDIHFLTFDDEEGAHAFRHSSSHIMAQAVKRLFPRTKLSIGPAIEDGFYYDFDVEEHFTPDILEKIEAEMKKIVKEDLAIERFELDDGQA